MNECNELKNYIDELNELMNNIDELNIFLILSI